MNPRMLSLLRESRGLSQSALAREARIPQSAISRAENGLGELDPARVEAIAAALRYPTSAFDWADEVVGFGSASFHHRKQQALGLTTLQRIHADINLTRMRIARLLRGIEMTPRHHFQSIEVDDLGTPQDVAKAVRAYWRLPMGPISNMMRTLENAGALIVRADLYSPRISAISISAPGSPPMFVLNEGMPADRERFTLAHEAGHITMHDIPTRPDDAESEADAFAAEFLMPENEIRPELRNMDMTRAAQLKQRWKVAMSAIIRRARDLNQIDDSRYRSLNVQISQRGWRKIEPVELERENPSLLSQVISVHHDQHGYSVEELADLTGLVRSEYVARFGDHPPRTRLHIV